MMRGISGIAALGILVLSLPSAHGGDGEVPEPDGYRTGDYRSPTPNSLKGARTASTADAEAMWKSGTAVFIDVMPHPPRPAGLPPGTIWREKSRLNIPGSIWLPDTGYGALAAATEEYFRAGLEQATGRDRSRALVFYCLMNCWMSWNAAKRAISIGYSNVVWYPDGTDGWQFAGLALEDAKPVPRPAE
jgi:PQQ-dependent catabolism-associated CXXCW motif protein